MEFSINRATLGWRIRNRVSMGIPPQHPHPHTTTPHHPHHNHNTTHQTPHNNNNTSNTYHI